jgi:hypothetical protein
MATSFNQCLRVRLIFTSLFILAIAVATPSKSLNGDQDQQKIDLNEDVSARADGSVYGMKRYSDVGYWVSYNRTNSDPPQVTITMQKFP